MNQIELKPTEYRRGPLRGHPLAHKVFMRASAFGGIWFVAVIAYGRLFAPPIPWGLVALVALAPGLMLAYIAISLDDD